MTTHPMFKISASVAEEYRKLKHKPDARREWSIIPLEAPIWEDEHPGSKCMLPSSMDEQSRISVMNLVEARTQLWLVGQVPNEFQQLWDDAKRVLPQWPGFQRLSIPDEEKEKIKSLRAGFDAVEAELVAEFGDTSRSVDEDGKT